jgi:hypothetical protein
VDQKRIFPTGVDQKCTFPGPLSGVIDPRCRRGWKALVPGAPHRRFPSAGRDTSEGDLRNVAKIQPCRRTISAIHSGANGEVQFGGVG